MKILMAALALAVPWPAFAQATADQQARIDAVLAEMKCEVDPENVEVENGVFDLDDVVCADGQYDIKLDAAFAVTERRKE